VSDKTKRFAPKAVANLFYFTEISAKQKFREDAHAKADEYVANATLLRRENVQSTFFIL